MCGHLIRSNVFDWRDWSPSTQIWKSALWMYYSSVLNLVKCSFAFIFNILRCQFFYLFSLLYFFFTVCFPVLLILVTVSSETAVLIFQNKLNCVQCTQIAYFILFFISVVLFCFVFLLCLTFNVHWIWPQTHLFIDTCCILILENAIDKHRGPVTLSKCLLMTLDWLPSKSSCRLVLWCISYHVTVY